MSKGLFAHPPLNLVHLSGPKPGTPHCQMNLVLVHGIDGYHLTTWTSQAGSKPWYETIISTAPNLSVSTVDIPYSHRKWISGSEKYLEQLSVQLLEKIVDGYILDRPTMFLCHSLGGILLKRVIIDALSSAKGTSLDRRRANWRKIAFIGVPHNGSPWAKTWFAKLLILMRSETSRDLKPGKRFLVAVDKGFEQSITRYQLCSIHSFHETKPIFQGKRVWLVGPILRRAARYYGPIVPQSYSTLQNILATDHQIEACHFEVSNLDSPHAGAILDLVKIFCAECSSKSSEQSYLFHD